MALVNKSKYFFKDKSTLSLHKDYVEGLSYWKYPQKTDSVIEITKHPLNFISKTLATVFENKYYPGKDEACFLNGIVHLVHVHNFLMCIHTSG